MTHTPIFMEKFTALVAQMEHTNNYNCIMVILKIVDVPFKVDRFGSRDLVGRKIGMFSGLRE